MKPIILLPPDAMSKEDIERLRENGLCVVEANQPERVTFMDPIPAIEERGKVEQAAILLSRKIMGSGYWNDDGSTRKEIVECFYDILIKGTPLDPRPTKEEREREIFDNAKADELRRLAREEAKAERAAAKTAEKGQKKS